MIEKIKEHKDLAIAISYLGCLQILDATTTTIALNSERAQGALYESNSFMAYLMSLGFQYWLGMIFVTFVFMSSVITWYYFRVRNRYPSWDRYFLFIIAIAMSGLTATVFNNMRLIVGLWM